MPTSEIEKLERRYTENPHGLTFAPLAEVHRKNGDLARALELLTAGLELHPNYIPASIVLGRCHQDLGDLAAAEAAFAHVLRLDDENVIALKSLADISERMERFGEAEAWLHRLVAVDRSNDEAKEQLRRVEAARHSEQGTEVEPVAPAPSLELIDITPEPAAEIPEPSEPPAAVLSAGVAPAEPGPPAPEAAPPQEAASRDELQAQAAPPSWVAETVDEEPEETAEPEREVALARELAPAEVSPAEASLAPAPEDASTSEETVRPLPGLISAEFQPPLEAIGGLGVETSEEVVLEVSGESEFRVPDASEDLKVKFEKPDASLEAEPEVLREAASAEPVNAKSYVAAETKGQSVADFFRALVAARPPGGGVGEQPARNPAPGPAISTDDQKSDEAVSFDDFFNSEGDGSNPQRGASEPGKDDLDQFQSWLQNLKR